MRTSESAHEPAIPSSLTAPFPGRENAMNIVVNARNLERKRKQAAKSRIENDRHHYFQGVAQARFVLRKVFRLIEEQAKMAGLDSLEHQALIQVYGSPEMRLQVKEVAKRLDIAPAFASIVLKNLQEKGVVSRVPGQKDQRTTFVAITAKGKALLHKIDEQVRVHVDFFTRQLDNEIRESAVSIMLFYLGLTLHHSD